MFVQYQENKSAAKTDSFVVVDRYMFMKTPADRFGCTIYANGRDVKQNETDWPGKSISINWQYAAPGSGEETNKLYCILVL